METTEAVRKRYDRFARFYDKVEGLFERRLFRRWREETISSLHETVLEVGVGTGKNLPYYSKSTKLTAIDISPKMMEHAQIRAQKLDVNVTFHLMDAQNMKFKDNTFDVVITTFVLCSVPDPMKALQEIRRVTKKDGKIILIEHVLSNHKLIALWQHIHNPIMRRITGANMNRNTKRNIELAGLTIDNDEHLALFDIFRRFTCRK